jgi:hypothetical protein
MVKNQASSARDLQVQLRGRRADLLLVNDFSEAGIVQL